MNHIDLHLSVSNSDVKKLIQAIMSSSLDDTAAVKLIQSIDNQVSRHEMRRTSEVLKLKAEKM